MPTKKQWTLTKVSEFLIWGKCFVVACVLYVHRLQNESTTLVITKRIFWSKDRVRNNRNSSFKTWRMMTDSIYLNRIIVNLTGILWRLPHPPCEQNPWTKIELFLIIILILIGILMLNRYKLSHFLDMNMIHSYTSYGLRIFMRLKKEAQKVIVLNFYI